MGGLKESVIKNIVSYEVKDSLDDIIKRVNSIENKLENINGSLNQIKIDINDIRKDISMNRRDIDNILKGVATLSVLFIGASLKFIFDLVKI